MKLHYKIVVLGAKSTGKTSIIHQLIYGKISNVDPDTIEDIYSGIVTDNERGNAKERVHFIDTQSLGSPVNLEAIKLYLAYADAFILVYAINDLISFQIMDQIKHVIERFKEKKEIPIISLGNKTDKFRERQIALQEWQGWIQKERVQIFEVNAADRSSLMEPIRFLINKLAAQSTNKSSFPQLRKTKATNISLEL